MKKLPQLRFLEQYDPEDLTTAAQPHAYVCDQVHKVQLGVDVDDVRGKGVDNDAWAALVELRDQLAPAEKVAWFIVVNGDEERWVPRPDGAIAGSTADGSQTTPASQTSKDDTPGDEDQVCPSKPAICCAPPLSISLAPSNRSADPRPSRNSSVARG